MMLGGGVGAETKRESTYLEQMNLTLKALAKKNGGGIGTAA